MSPAVACNASSAPVAVEVALLAITPRPFPAAKPVAPVPNRLTTCSFGCAVVTGGAVKAVPPISKAAVVLAAVFVKAVVPAVRVTWSSRLSPVARARVPVIGFVQLVWVAVIVQLNPVLASFW